MKKLIIVGLAAICMAACTVRPQIPEAPGSAGTREVSIVISGGGLPPVDTRSSVTAYEDGIRTASLLFYKDGVLDEKLNRTVTFSGSGVNNCTVTVEMKVGDSYDILAMVNASAGTVPSSLKEALSGLCCEVSDVSSWNTKGLPMSGRVHYDVTPSSSSVEIPLSRLVAKVNLTVRTSGIKHGNIKFTSMSVRQMNSVCPFFSDGKATKKVCDGDIASASEIQLVNANRSGYECTFYVLENLQGNILAGNRDPEAKVPDKVQAAGRNPGLCTYLELRGDYSGSSGHLVGEPLTARLFLGADACTNFDIVRNNQYNIELAITDDGCLKTDWKIDGNLLDSRELSFKPASSSLASGGSTSVQLSTNLSYSAGDYSYSVSGDLMYFTVNANSGATQFSVSCSSSAPEGAQIQIHASTWDGKLTAVHYASVPASKGGSYDCEWLEGSSILYLAQRGVLYVKDAVTGGNPSGTVTVSGTTGAVDVTRYGAHWRIDAVQTGEDKLVVKLDGKTIKEVSVSCVAPVLKFPSDRLFLPIDGSVVTCGPYYHKVDGTLLEYSDFVPELYEELLDVSVQRSVSSQQYGRKWRGSGAGNPVVKSRMMATTHSVFGYWIDKLEVDGVSIESNYDFSDGPVTLEKIEAFPNDRECGVESATAELYTEDPFSGSVDLGTRKSWALARWYDLSDRNETFTFTFDDLLLPGNDASLATVVYPFSEEGKFKIDYIDRNTVKLTILYNDYVETAMPEQYFALAPAIRNRNSGQTYYSCHRLTVNFTVNLAVAGVAVDNGAGCAVSVEWAFPRLDEGRLSYIEKHAVAAYSDAGIWKKGMYEWLYFVLYYSPDYIMETEVPAYSFADLGKAPSVISSLSGTSYHVPEVYGGGYDLVLWKYEALYPETNGWLSK